MKAANDNWKTRIKWGCIGVLIGLVAFWAVSCVIVSGALRGGQ